MRDTEAGHVTNGFFPQDPSAGLTSLCCWGWVLQGMWMMLQVDTPEDYVLATGETHPVSPATTAATSQ